MRYLSLLRDSIRESLDRKSFIITLIFCALLILTCATIGFEPYPVEKAVQQRIANHFRFHAERSSTASRGWLARDFPVYFKVTQAKETEKGWSTRMEVSPLHEFQKLVCFYVAAKDGRVKTPMDPIPGVSPDGKTVEAPPSRDSMSAFIEERMRGLRFTGKATFEDVDPRTLVLRLDFEPRRPEFFVRGHRVDVLFGTWKIDMELTEPADSVYFIQKLLAGVIVGWAGILAGIVVTAAFIPNMLQKGMIDLILARPVSRWKVFLLKYVGGLTYVFVTALFLIGGCWVALGLRSGSWSPAFLMCIPLLVFFFAAIYSVSAFIGLHKRNITEAIMVAILSWLALTGVGTMRTEMHRPGSSVDPNGFWMRAVDLLHAVTPPLGEVGTAMSWFLMKGNEIPPDRFNMSTARGPREEYPNVRWAQLFGVTSAWMALLLAISCWTFTRRDY